MTDVRLTATNPEDSSVVLVACNSRGELLVTEPVIEQIDNNVTIEGALTVNTISVLTSDPEDVSSIGGNKFLACRQAGVSHDSFDVTVDGQIKVRKVVENDILGLAYQGTNNNAFEVRNKHDVVRWNVSYSGTASGPTFLINTDADNPDNWQTVTRDGESTSTYTGPVLDVGAELVFLRAQVRVLMEKLKMSPEGGWPVWDGSTET